MPSGWLTNRVKTRLKWKAFFLAFNRFFVGLCDQKAFLAVYRVETPSVDLKFFLIIKDTTQIKQTKSDVMKA